MNRITFLPEEPMFGNETFPAEPMFINTPLPRDPIFPQYFNEDEDERLKKRPYYITTPIYYPSDKLHIGHSYCTTATDVLARYKRLQGYDVMFITGADEHGQKIEKCAKAAGINPQRFVDLRVDDMQELWGQMNISNERFMRTTAPFHEEAVQKIFRHLFETGDIYKSTYKGKYCTDCEAFWTETQLKDGTCPDCGRPVQDAEEEAYFFRLSNYRDKLITYYEEHPDFMEPKARFNEMINNFIKPGLEDLCVSRTSFTWGVQVDFDPKHVVYVWLDALTNYITALGYENDYHDDFARFWPADVHIVGKEIMRFHAIIWPAILMALDLPLPKKIYGHGWLLLDGGKMSKSKGNVIDPVVLCNRYGTDAVRYFLMREIPFGSDGVFSNEALINRINSDLANDLGNLLSRTVAMVDKYFDGHLTGPHMIDPMDDDLITMIATLRPRYEAQMEAFAFHNALAEVFKVISRTNKYIDETAPWILGRDENRRSRLACVLYNLLEALRVSAVLLSPFMPDTADQIAYQIGAYPSAVTYQNASYYGVLPTTVGVHKAEPLFPRIDLDQELLDLDDDN